MSLHTNIPEDECEYQTSLQRVLAESSVSVVWKIHGPSRATLLTGAWNQRNEADFQSYLQRVLALSSHSSAKQESSITVVENKLKFTLDIYLHPIPSCVSACITIFKIFRESCGFAAAIGISGST